MSEIIWKILTYYEIIDHIVEQIMSVITQVSKELKCGFNQTYGNQVSLLLIHLKVPLHIYNFCYNSTIIRLIASSYYSKIAAQIILPPQKSKALLMTRIPNRNHQPFFWEFRNKCTSFKCFFKTEHLSKHIYQKLTFTKKTMMLLEAVVRRCSSK